MCGVSRLRLSCFAFQLEQCLKASGLVQILTLWDLVWFLSDPCEEICFWLRMVENR